jgi:hypothetical protein
VASMGSSERLQAINISKTANPTSISLPKSLERSVHVCQPQQFPYRWVFSTQFKLRHPVPSSPRLRMRRPQQGLELLKDQCLSCFLPFRGLSEVAQVAWGFTFEHKNGWPLFESETIRKWTCYDSEPCYMTPQKPHSSIYNRVHMVSRQGRA